MKRKVMPEALRVLRLKASRRFTNLGKLASEVGWKHRELVHRLEAKRKVKSEEFFLKKQEEAKLLNQAKEEADLTEVNATLEKFGY